ncbi:uncharacterized protein N0V89_004135 [Didymosphaeria variabile]|uniref:NAD-dependent epimerase/dehydratase domain-containing protein n=1 Tax=Didymosphaeria variabile TaxID=1932322 RepID=A0A9W8XPU2_9PLEO|nr:uncharacterized protein N0V89_004135 [Didymosphaeria variabile]KAJ4356107.1 hypothetical protein N0V89_004135 [Didymosphaeria variabile]
MARILLTGGTGYIGGDVLYRLLLHGAPKNSISCLVRDHEKAKQLSKIYPDVRIVEGDLDDVQLVEKEAREADIVAHLAVTSHFPSSEAIVRGLTQPERGRKGYWIQISGATLLAADEIKDGRFGFATDKSYDDVKDIKDIHSIITANPKRLVDNLVLVQDKINTALIVGPHIYGLGRGPSHTRSVQAPEIARATLKLKEGFRLGEGKNRWSNIHVNDLSDLVASLVEAAAEGETADGQWGKDGIYFPENGNMTFGDLSAKIAKEAQKQSLIPKGSAEKVIDAKEADALSEQPSIRPCKSRRSKEMSKNLKKNVTFAPLASAKVYFIARGQGTWDNGQMRADSPTPYEVASLPRLAAQTLAHIEHNEKTGTDVKRKPLVQGTPHIDAQNGAQSAREPTQPSGSATFDAFLPQEKLLDEHTHRRPNTKSFGSLASLKSLSKNFKQKILGDKNKF